MNRVFKSKWSVAHQEYVVTDENHRSRGKAAKSAVALAVTALMLGAGAASAAYVDPGSGHILGNPGVSEGLGSHGAERLNRLRAWLHGEGHRGRDHGFRRSHADPS